MFERKFRKQLFYAISFRYSRNFAHFRFWTEKFVRTEFVVRWATQTAQKCSKYCYFRFCITYHKTDSDIKIHRKLLSLVGRTALKHINQRRSFFYINYKGSVILRVTVSHVHRFFERTKKIERWMKYLDRSVHRTKTIFSKTIQNPSNNLYCS